MLKHLDLTIHRIGILTDDLRPLIYDQSRPLPVTVFSAPGRISREEALKGRYRPTKEGETFGPRWSTHWFRIEAEVPREWKGREVWLRFLAKGEGCVFDEDGRILQGITPADWNNIQDLRSHCRLYPRAKGGERRTLHVEFAVNGLLGFGMNPGTDPKDLTGNGELRECRLYTRDKTAWDLWHDLLALLRLARQLPAEHALRGKAVFAANAAANVLRLEDRATYAAALRVTREFFEENRGAMRFHVTAVGHGHIDTAWLWPLAESERKCVRTFANQLQLMEDYPEHRFVSSSAQHYAWVKRNQPALYARLKKEVRAGHFVPVGGTWIEPDCNLPSGESLVRQFLLGQRFFEREFGARCREFWNPDVFGYCAAMPQIMAQCGVQLFITQKLSWNQFNKPVSNTFLWEGIDGTRVLTHFPPADTYNGNCQPSELLKSMSGHRDLERCDHALYLYGVGDGGGGPTAEMLEQMRRLGDLDGLPRTEPGKMDDFADNLLRHTRDPLVWNGELYFELHRGTYTSQAANKRDNRRMEEALHDVEFLAALAHLQGRAPYPVEALRGAWETLCLNQFHDIIPGSSIQEVYRDSDRDYARLREATGKLLAGAASALWLASAAKKSSAKNSASAPTTGEIVLNTLGFSRREIVDTPAGPRLLAAPALGVAPAADETPRAPARARRAGKRLVLENDLVRATFDATGGLVSFFDKRHDRECVASGAVANRFVLHEDKPACWDAWDVDAFHLESRLPLGEGRDARVVSEGPLLAALEFTYPLTAASRLVQTVRLAADSPALEFVNHCDWHEEAKFLKVEFPLALRSDHATYEIQFGHVRRPTHFNTSWDWARFEVCAHRWADLSEPTFGVALLNDSKYGHACHGNVLRLSLLRAPRWPDRECDRGAHSFRYALLPHAGSPQQAAVHQAAAAFNQPLRLLAASTPPAEPVSFFSVDQPAVVIDTVKKAEDGDDLIVRLYEASGSAVRTTFRTPLPFRSVATCNLLEDADVFRPLPAGALPLELRPFQILSLRLRR